MRALTVIGVLLAGATATASAQHAHQIEFGGFGTYTRYDRAFGLDNQFGEGGWLGYFFNEYVGIEVEGNVAYPHLKPGGIGATLAPTLPHTQVRIGSASLVINGGGERNLLYVLGGYSKVDMGVNYPYNFALNAVHGGLGDRIFLTDRFALRIEARAYYAWKNCCLTGQWVGHVQGGVGLSYFLFGAHHEKVEEIPKARRDSILAAGGQLPPEHPRPGPTYEERGSDWQHKWYWGGEAGVLVFKTNFNGYAFEPTFGGHWLISGRRTALYVGYEQSFFLTPRQVTFVEPTGQVTLGNVSFNNLRRIMVGVLAFPAQHRVEPFAGGGLAIMEALNVVATCASCNSIAQLAQLQSEAQSDATKAFFWWMGGIDIKQGRLALYGHYVITTTSAAFLIQGPTHTFQGGIRYALGSAREDITGER